MIARLYRFWRSLPAAAVGLHETVTRHRPRVWLLWAAGTVLLLTSPFAICDPGVLMFVLDPELLALIAVSSIAPLRPAVADLIAHGERTLAGRGPERCKAGQRHHPRR